MYPLSHPIAWLSPDGGKHVVCLVTTSDGEPVYSVRLGSKDGRTVARYSKSAAWLGTGMVEAYKALRTHAASQR